MNLRPLLKINVRQVTRLTPPPPPPPRSDGSNFIFVWDSVTKTELRRMEVRTSQGRPVRFLNELEWYNGDILANVWYSDVIVRIDVETGIVKHIYDLKKLYPKKDRNEEADCLNGIAKMKGSDDLFVTGKQFNKGFRIRLDPE
jgi:glutaminyl-peptide cyclotransferase